jgi:hypothetical protein
MDMKSKEPTSSSHPALEVRIERVVLSGCSPADTHRLEEVLQAELTQLIQGRGINRSAVDNLSIERLDGGSLKAESSPNINALGAKVAANLHQILASAPATRPTQMPPKTNGAKR